ncbi:TPA: ATP-binding protein [Escherichia coli]|nr:ATP-binding protein [Escherichia coli]
MYKQAFNILMNLDRHILVTGSTGTGKTTMLTDALVNNDDVKYYHFPEMEKEYIALCDENLDEYDFLSVSEKTLILDSVAIGKNLYESKIVRFIKTARKHGKRLIVVTSPSDGERIKELFGAVIALSGNGNINTERTCSVDILS